MEEVFEHLYEEMMEEARKNGGEIPNAFDIREKDAACFEKMLKIVKASSSDSSPMPISNQSYYDFGI